MTSVVLEEEYDPFYEPTDAEILEYAQFLEMDLENDKDLFWIAKEGTVRCKLCMQCAQGICHALSLSLSPSHAHTHTHTRAHAHTRARTSPCIIAVSLFNRSTLRRTKDLPSRYPQQMHSRRSCRRNRSRQALQLPGRCRPEHVWWWRACVSSRPCGLW